MGKKSNLMHIDDVTNQTRQSGKLGPIMPVFQHAPFDPESLIANTTSSLTTVWEADKPKLDLSINSSNMTYTYVEGEGNPFYTTYVALRNKKTGKTRLIEANQVVMKPKVNYPPTKNPLLLQENIEATTFAEKMAASKHLIKSFGQAKGARFYDQQDRMKVDAGQIEDKISKAAGSVTEDRLAEAPKLTEIEIIPKRYEGATRAGEVYDFKSMLTELELKQLTESVDEFYGEHKTVEDLEKSKEMRYLSPFGLYYLKQFLQSEHDVTLKTAMVLYMEGIIKFSRMRQGELKNGIKLLQKFLPLNVKHKILDSFSLGQGQNNRTKVVTPEMADRALCHIIVLGLLAGALKFDVSLLVESVRVRNDHLRKLVSMVGAHIKSDSVTQQQLIVLSMPLATFNMNYVGKKKGARN